MAIRSHRRLRLKRSLNLHFLAKSGQKLIISMNRFIYTLTITLSVPILGIFTPAQAAVSPLSRHSNQSYNSFSNGGGVPHIDAWSSGTSDFMPYSESYRDSVHQVSTVTADGASISMGASGGRWEGPNHYQNSISSVSRFAYTFRIDCATNYTLTGRWTSYDAATVSLQLIDSADGVVWTLGELAVINTNGNLGPGDYTLRAIVSAGDPYIIAGTGASLEATLATTPVPAPGLLGLFVFLGRQPRRRSR